MSESEEAIEIARDNFRVEQQRRIVLADNLLSSKAARSDKYAVAYWTETKRLSELALEALDSPHTDW